MIKANKTLVATNQIVGNQIEKLNLEKHSKPKSNAMIELAEKISKPKPSALKELPNPYDDELCISEK